MQCEPGKILNPITLRCVSLAGKVGKQLYDRGYVQNAELAQGLPFTRHTRRQPQRKNAPCDYGYERNPVTGRCVKYGGKTHKKIHRVDPYRSPVPYRTERPRRRSPRNPYKTERIHRRWPLYEQTTTDDPGVIPIGEAGTAPMADKKTILKWTHKNCKYPEDVLTRRPFVNESQSSLQKLIRLHDGTCVSAPILNDYILRKQKMGITPMLPNNRVTPLKRRNLDALRETMRRRSPGYKFPAHSDKLPPPEWKLYAASDKRSGPDFLSVCYVDITKARRTAIGVEFPMESIRVNMGFLPVEDGDGFIKLILSIMKKLSDKNNLLTYTVRGWKAAAGFPFTKSHWARDRSDKLNELYRDLISLD